MLVRDLNEIDLGVVLRTYRGRPGCGCGCRGTYTSERWAMRKVLHIMAARASEVEIMPEDAKDGVILALEDERQYLWAYLAKGVKVEHEPVAERTAPVAGAMVL
jgi:hypothetical protein